MTTATIVSTGEELLSGSTVDRNSSYIAQRLSCLDVTIMSHVVIGDDQERIVAGIDAAALQSDIVIITGGLGATDDDNTAAAVALLCGTVLDRDDNAYKRMLEYFSIRKRQVTDDDIKMSLVPRGSEVIHNSTGLAPGFIVNHAGSCIIALPGVPHEMKQMLDNTVMPYLINRFRFDSVENTSIRIVDLKESEVNAKIREIVKPFDTISWGITASSGIITVTFRGAAGTRRDMEQLIDHAQKIFLDRMLVIGISYPEEELIDSLDRLNMTISTAESCTGGLISKRLTDVPGASRVFQGGATAYSNASKIEILQVPDALIETHGAVSEEVAVSMAQGARKAFASDIALATTGIAGPGGGSAMKPVGTVCFGFAVRKHVVTETRQFPGNRETIRAVSSTYAIDFMRRYLINM